MLTLITFLLVLSILVIAHELGHFWTARKFGVKAEEFGLGFPPRIFGFYKDNQGKWKKVIGRKEVVDSPKTIYSLNWFPLGGFVRIKGEDGGSEGETDSFASKKIWQRASMISAGVIMNIILAAVLISFGFMIGLPQGLDGKINPRGEITDKKIQVIEVVKDSPAEAANFKIGDIIISVDGNSFANFQELQDYADMYSGQELSYIIKREGGEIEKRVTPIIMKETNKGGVGIGIVETGIVKYPWHVAIWEGIKTTALLVGAITVAFYDLILGMIIGQGVSASVSGPVGIATLSGQVARMGFVYVLQFTAILSINLAILNFFPFPALDGGRFIFLIIEKLKGSPVKREVEATIHNVGFALLMILVLVVTFRDIFKIFN